jgi:murein DD-endopeptidase MepM/ murein hydrolase activator NlpD
VAAAPVVPAPPPLPAVAEIVTKPTAPRKTVPVQTATLVTEPRVSAHRPWEAVLDGPARLTSEFGPRNDPFNGRIRDHEGIDLAASRGTKVYPLADGRVTFSGWNRSYGNVVIVSHGDGLETLYGHHERNHVRAGDRVSSSTALGSVGSTGRATAPHLHLEVHRAGEPVDPIPFMTGRAPLPSATPAGP